MSVSETIRAHAAAQIDATVAFAARLVQTPSMPGQEGDVAALVRQEMQKLGYDEVQVDAAGNVIGLLRGSGSGRSLLFNTHMDHVSPGDRSHWHVDPFSGQIADGQLWGRASTDIKGSLACQVYTVPLLRAAGLLPAGDVYVTAVVMEEIGGLGMQHLATHLRADSAIVGEPSNCLLKRGHRGRTGLQVTITGKAGHASMPDRAVNPHTVAAGFLLALRDLPMASHPDFGSATLAPTIYRSDNESINVIPESVSIHLDWRTVPGEDAGSMVKTLQARLDAALLPGSHGTVAVVQDDMTSYSGMKLSLPSVFRPYALPEDHWAVQIAEQVLGSGPAGLWRFATDGGHLHDAGVPPLGFGPGLEEHCHIADERISIAQMEQALAGNARLALALTDTAGATP
ncbi:MAG: N-formyl-4-amino-5-aminomethyl-2-methylpyrimidine deformylase [Chloroflexi bacterium]|nr:N-formyl-4-amino-5-aminomethyl-2-methylpyrimidine deformylase [Chloroflexota bacterium]